MPILASRRITGRSDVAVLNRPFHSNPRLQGSMSSIKRDVKKKVLPRPEVEKILVSRSSPLSVVPIDFARQVLLWLVCPSCGFHLPLVTTPIES